MGVSKKPEDRLRARTTVLTTDDEKNNFFESCAAIGAEPTSRLREFMRIDAEDYVKAKK